MIKIGITGSLASGKSTVSRIFAGTKYPLFNADLQVSKIYRQKMFANKIFKVFRLNNKKNLKQVLSVALKAHKLLKCRGVTRSDFRFYNNKFYLLELNTQPGMTSLSLVPEIASYYGISFIKLIEILINDASIKK